MISSPTNQTNIFFIELRKKLLQNNKKIQDLFKVFVFLKNPNEITKSQFAQISYFLGFFDPKVISQIYRDLQYGNSIPIQNFTYAYYEAEQAIKLKKVKVLTYGPKKQTSDDFNFGMLTLHQGKEKGSKTQRTEQNQDLLQIYTKPTQLKSNFTQSLNQNMHPPQVNPFKSINSKNETTKIIFKEQNQASLFSNPSFGVFNKAKQQNYESFRMKQDNSTNPFNFKNSIFTNISSNNIDKEKNQFLKSKPDYIQKKSFSQTTNTFFLHSKPIQTLSELPKYQDKRVKKKGFRQEFPKCSKYYLQYQPSIQELEHFKILENLLENSNNFSDKNNPKLHLGKYLSSEHIFKSCRYQVFQKSNPASKKQERDSLGEVRAKIESKDVMQGENIQNSYFLSPIVSIIQHYPQLIKEKFLFSGNPAHFYVIRLFIDGQWIYIRTDDDFPCFKNKPLFAQPHGNEIWVMLLEKCWAKIFGSYKAIQIGFCSESFLAISGAPCEYLSTQNQNDDEKIKQKLQEYYDSKYPVSVSGSKYLEQISEEGQDVGLIPNHAYSLLKICYINGETVIKLRSPSKDSNWQGDWSFQSQLWTPQLRNTLQLEWQFFKSEMKAINIQAQRTFIILIVQLQKINIKKVFILYQQKSNGKIKSILLFLILTESVAWKFNNCKVIILVVNSKKQ